MGYKGALRSIQTELRRAERDAQRRQRELEKQHKQLEKMQELERAAYEVQVYENHIDLLLSVHKECSDTWDWEKIQSSEPPTKPAKSHTHEELAKAKLDKFKPGVFDKILGRAEPNRDKLVRNVREARETDEKEYQEALQAYEQEYADWGAAREVGSRILGWWKDVYTPNWICPIFVPF